MKNLACVGDNPGLVLLVDMSFVEAVLDRGS